MDNLYYLLALNRIPALGPRTISQFLTRWPKLKDLFALPFKELVAAGIAEPIVQALTQFNFHHVEADLLWEKDPEHSLLTWLHPHYPPLLREIAASPPVLYCIGDLSSLAAPTIAVVGTRKPSIVGADIAWRFAYELASQAVTIVSGLALGIDTRAHQGAIAAGGKTVAVLGTGIDVIYPASNKALASKMLEQGLILSEFPLKSPPIAGHFPRRNRIISGLSLSTLVVEAAIRSGSLITARFALEQNRDVFAVPGSIYNQQSQGCHYLLQQGAKLATTSQDILDDLQLSPCASAVLMPNPLASENENLVKCMGFELTTIDQLITRSGLCVEAVLSRLAELELQGEVTAVPGGYMRCKV